MKRTFAFFLLACCLFASLLAAPLAEGGRTPLEDNEVVDTRMIREGPSKMTPRIVLPLEGGDGVSKPDESVSTGGRQLEVAPVEENRLLGEELLGTVIALPSTLAKGLERLLNGVVGGLLGRPSDASRR